MKYKLLLIFIIIYQNFAFTENGITESHILLGQSCVLTGPTKELGKELKDGADAYFNYANNNKILTKQIKLISYDDGYEPVLCKKNTSTLINKDKVFSLFSYVGTPTTEAALPLIDDTGIPLIAPFSGAGFLRNPKEGKRNIFNIRATYEQETSALVKRFIEDLNVKRFAVFYQKDSFGKIGLMGTIKAINRYGAELVSSGSYIRNTCLIKTALDHIHKNKPEAIIMIGAYKPCAAFIKKSKSSGFTSYFANISFVGTRQLINELGNFGENTFISQVVPSPYDDSIAVVKECKEILGHTPSYGELEGFLNAKVTVMALNNAGVEISRNSFIKALEGMKKTDIGGLEITFGKYDHQGLNKVFFTKIKNGKAIPVSNFN